MSSPFEGLRDSDDEPRRQPDRWYHSPATVFFLLLTVLLTSNLITLVSIRLYTAWAVQSAMEEMQEKMRNAR